MGIIRRAILAVALAVFYHSEIAISFTPSACSSSHLFQMSITRTKTPFNRNGIADVYRHKPLRLAGAGSIPITGVTELFQRFPYLAAFFTCGVKASAADAVAQVKDRKLSGHNTFHILRNVAFILYGGLYTGLAQEYLYNHFLPRLFGAGTALSVAGMVCFDMLVIFPFLCLPMAYIVKGVVLQQGGVLGGLQHYKTDVMERGLLFKSWSLWTPVQCLTFSVIPPHFRVPFMAAVSFFWLIILSRFTSRSMEATGT